MSDLSPSLERSMPTEDSFADLDRQVVDTHEWMEALGNALSAARESPGEPLGDAAVAWRITYGLQQTRASLSEMVNAADEMLGLVSELWAQQQSAGREE